MLLVKACWWKSWWCLVMTVWVHYAADTTTQMVGDGPVSAAGCSPYWWLQHRGWSSRWWQWGSGGKGADGGGEMEKERKRQSILSVLGIGLASSSRRRGGEVWVVEHLPNVKKFAEISLDKVKSWTRGEKLFRPMRGLSLVCGSLAVRGRSKIWFFLDSG